MITVAIAEDHKSLSDGLKLFLEQDPEIRVLFAVENGKEMLERLETSLPDVVLTDISMPEMNGIELCKNINTTRDNIKIIALSMFENTGAIKDMLDAGAHGYVVKSSPLTDLRTAIHEVYKGNVYFDQHMKLQLEEIATFTSRKHALSRSERDILISIARGKSSQQIADDRGTALSTVHKHRKNMIRKLGLVGTGELLQYALKQHGHSN